MKKLSLLLALALAALVLAVPAFAGKLDDIKAKGVLVCGVKDSTPPFGFVDETSKTLTGFDIDVCTFIAGKIGVKTEFKPVTSQTRIPMLTQGSIDLIVATMTHTIKRDEVVDFSITYFGDEQKLLVKKGGEVKSVADLAGKKVGTAKGSTSEKNVKAAQPKADVLSFDDYPAAFLALQQGKVAAVTTDSTILVGLKAKAEKPEEWELVGDAIAAEPYGIAMVENESKFRDLVNAALMEMWTTGEYKKTFEKWMGPQTKYFIPFTWKMEVWPVGQ